MLGFLALGASTMHLGRPLEAWRSFVGLGTSWLSREIMIFGLFAMLALIYAGSFWLPALSGLREHSVWAGIVLFAGAERVRNWCGGDRAGRSVLLDDDLSRYPADVLADEIHRPKFTGTTVLLGPATILFTMTLQSLFVTGIVTPPAFRQVIVLLCGFLAVSDDGKIALGAHRLYSFAGSRVDRHETHRAPDVRRFESGRLFNVSFAEHSAASCCRCWCYSALFPRSSQLESCLFRCSVNCSSAICFSRR